MSITLEFLPLDESELPVEKIFIFDKQYIFRFRGNESHDRVYCEIRNTDDEVLYTTRLTYGANLIHAVVENLDIEESITAFDIDDIVTDAEIEDMEVTPENLDRIKLYVTS